MTRSGTVFVRRLREERGIALPVSIAVLSVVMLLGALAIQQAVGATGGANRDSAVKRGGQAATAGLETAMRRLNTFSSEMSGSVTPCVATDATVRLYDNSARADGSAWFDCGWEQLGNDESYRYSVSSAVDDGADSLLSTVERQVVSVGESGAVSRRVMSTTRAFDMRMIFGDYTAISDVDLELSNQGDIGSPEVRGNARSNANILLNHPNSNIYGDATPGPDGTVSNPSRVIDGSTAPADELLEFPAVTMPSPNEVDGAVCAEPCTGSYSWSPTTRRLALTGGNVVLTGNVFSFCSLTVQNNSKLSFRPVDPSLPIRVYIDSPDNCLDASGNPPSASISWSNNPTVEFLPPGAEYPPVQFYVVGDEPPTTISFSNNNDDHIPFQIYAPHSNVSISNRAYLVGGVIAKKLTLANNTHLEPPDPDLSIPPLDLPGPDWEEELFLECTSTPPPATESPGQGC